MLAAYAPMQHHSAKLDLLFTYRGKRQATLPSEAGPVSLTAPMQPAATGPQTCAWSPASRPRLRSLLAACRGSRLRLPRTRAPPLLACLSREDMVPAPSPRGLHLGEGVDRGGCSKSCSSAQGSSAKGGSGCEEGPGDKLRWLPNLRRFLVEKVRPALFLNGTTV